MNFKKLFFSDTSKDSLILLSGTIVSNLINLLIVFILARSVSSGNLGLIFTGLIFIQLVTDLLELGINPALLALAPSHLTEQKKLVSSSFSIKLLISLVSSGICYLFSSQIAWLIFKNNQMNYIIQISSLGIIFLTIIFWSQTIFISLRDFKTSMLINTSINILRLLGISYLLFLGIIGMLDFYLAMQLVLFVSVCIIFYKLNYLLSLRSIEKDLILKVLRFGFPIGMGFALAALYTKLDQILILRISGEEEAGIYGLASRLSMFFIFAVSAFNSAIIPRLTSLENSQLKSYFQKSVVASRFLALGSFGIVILGALVIPFVFGKQFISSMVPFEILGLGMVFFILSTPYSSIILYRYKKNYYSFWMSLLSVILIFILLEVFIPNFKSIGAALSVCLIYFLQLIINYIYYKKLSKN